MVDEGSLGHVFSTYEGFPLSGSCYGCSILIFHSPITDTRKPQKLGASVNNTRAQHTCIRSHNSIQVLKLTSTRHTYTHTYTHGKANRCISIPFHFQDTANHYIKFPHVPSSNVICNIQYNSHLSG